MESEIPLCNFRNRQKYYITKLKIQENGGDFIFKTKAYYFHFNHFLWTLRCRFEGKLVLGIRKILSHALFVYQFSVFTTVSSLHFNSVFKSSISIAVVILQNIRVYSFHYHWNHEKKNQKISMEIRYDFVTLYSDTFDSPKLDIKNNAIYHSKLIFGVFFSILIPYFKTILLRILFLILNGTFIIIDLFFTLILNKIHIYLIRTNLCIKRGWVNKLTVRICSHFLIWYVWLYTLSFRREKI